MDDSQSLCHSKYECKYHVYGYPKGAVRCYMGGFASIWASYSTVLHARRSARSLKDTFVMTMFTS